jgi:hypothetical protein
MSTTAPGDMAKARPDPLHVFRCSDAVGLLSGDEPGHPSHLPTLFTYVATRDLSQLSGQASTGADSAAVSSVVR